ncbi:MAG: hypothetical protein VB102_04470 [Paludibacter sp.]|nr:hypothetical protein [Paludibacter sp.]
MNRRTLLSSLGSMFAVTALSSCVDEILPSSLLEDKILIDSKMRAKLIAERKKRRVRIRRVIMNNDGGDVAMSTSSAGTIITPEAFLNMRTSSLYNSHVDTVFYCDGINNVYSHESNLTEQPQDERSQNTINCLKEIETDTLSVVINWCKQYNKEVFWSMRMNDNHDSTRPQLLSQLKINHPGYCVGVKGTKMPLMYNKWSALNYNLAEVRKLVLDTFTDVVTRYDVDGIEFDFWRHPAFFKEQFYKTPITQAQCNLMTQLIRDVREVCDRMSIQRGKPILMAMRVPDSVGFCKAIGLDLVTWLQEDLVDLLIGADYFKLEPWEYWVNLGKQYNVPVYAAFEERRFSASAGEDDPEITDETNSDRWRGEAYLAWKAGVNGIYTYNLFDPVNELFWQLGDVKVLEKLPRIDITSYMGPVGSGYHDPDYWVVNGRSYYMNSLK